MQLPFPLADTPDDIAREKGRLLFARGSDFLKGVVTRNQFFHDRGKPLFGRPARVWICKRASASCGKMATFVETISFRTAIIAAGFCSY